MCVCVCVCVFVTVSPVHSDKLLHFLRPPPPPVCPPALTTRTPTRPCAVPPVPAVGQTAKGRCVKSNHLKKPLNRVALSSTLFIGHLDSPGYLSPERRKFNGSHLKWCSAGDAFATIIIPDNPQTYLRTSGKVCALVSHPCFV